MPCGEFTLQGIFYIPAVFFIAFMIDSCCKRSGKRYNIIIICKDGVRVCII